MKEYELPNFIQSNATRERYDKIVARGMTPLIIDCGANCGMSVLWWRKVFPLAKIIAIEPSSENFDALIANTHHDSRIECIKSAIWSRRTTLHVDNPADSAWALRFSDHGADLEERPSGQTDTITISEIIENEVSDDNLLILKIDIEGGEKQLFSENIDWISATPLLIIETHDSLQPGARTSLPLFKALVDHDYEICFNGENAFIFFSKAE